MSLISCPECGGKLSTAAEACPHCGHPAELITRPQQKPPKSAELKCYACSREATTRCQNCEKYSCPEHLRSIMVHYGKGGNHELRCLSCYVDAQKRLEDEKVFTWYLVIGIAILVPVLIASKMACDNYHREMNRSKQAPVFPRQLREKIESGRPHHSLP